MLNTIKGTAVCGGIATAPAFVIQRNDIEITKSIITDINKETEKLQLAYNNLVLKVKNLYKKMSALWNEKSKEIFNAFLMMLTDPACIENPIKLIKEYNYNSQYAIQTAIKEFIDIFKTIDSPYIRERINDLREIGYYLINEVSNIFFSEKSTPDKPFIIVSKRIGCIDLALSDKNTIKGIITECDMTNTHALLIAKTEEIPIITGVDGITHNINNKNIITVNGLTGEIKLS